MQACKRWHGLSMAQHAGKGGSTAESTARPFLPVEPRRPRAREIKTREMMIVHVRWRMHVMMKNDDDDMILPAPPAPKAGGGAETSPPCGLGDYSGRGWSHPSSGHAIGSNPTGGGSRRARRPTTLWRSVLLVAVRRIPSHLRVRDARVSR